MFPAFKFENAVNGVSVYSELQRHLGAIGISILKSPSDLTNLVFRNLAGVNIGTFSVSVFGNHVSNVLEIGSKKKVIGIYARRIIALVQNVKPIRNISDMKLPRKPVGQNRLGFNATVIRQPSVAVFINGSSPNPTRIGFESVFVKTLLPRAFVVESHSPVATFFRAGGISVGFGIEKFAAMGTVLLDHMKLTLSMVRGCRADSRRSHFLNSIKGLFFMKGFLT